MASSMTDIKTLRDDTGVSIMQCKKALEEAGGDIEKAKVILRKISSQVADKKGSRDLGAGTVGVYLHQGGSVAGVIVLSCETDFVAKNEEFKALAYDIAMHVAAMAPEFLLKSDVKDEDVAAAKAVFEEEAKDKPEDMREKIVEGKLSSYLKDKVLMEQAFVKDADKTIVQLISEATQKFGERVDITRMDRFSV